MKVLNKRTDKIPTDAVYVGRPTKWGNPFIIGVHGNREQVIEKYKLHCYKTFPLNDIKEQLQGKDLVCWCSPLACHADVLLEIANRREI